ncbi:MAG: HEPN domain-containing protein [Nanoarchaeota archaeon]
MKEINFLSKLLREEKLKIIEPSEELKISYIRKSESNLDSSKILLKNNKLEESITFTYYSMYHILTALLFKIGIKCENHTGSIILIKLLFGIDNSEMFSAKKERVDKQYYTDFKITKEEIIVSLKDTEKFNSLILDFISKLTNEEIARYREKFYEIVKK